MARPRVFEPGHRCSLNVYLHPEELSFLKQWGVNTNQSPSKIIRDFINQRRKWIENISKEVR